MRGETLALLLSILGLLATLFLYKLGTDVRKKRLKRERLTSKKRLYMAAQKRWRYEDLLWK